MEKLILSICRRTRYSDTRPVIAGARPILTAEPSEKRFGGFSTRAGVSDLCTSVSRGKQAAALECVIQDWRGSIVKPNLLLNAVLIGVASTWGVDGPELSSTSSSTCGPVPSEELCVMS